MTSKAVVFIVDDDVQLRTMVANVLGAEDFESHLFESAEEVETALTERMPSLVILDLSLRDSDGIEVIRSLTRARFAGSVLLISGHDVTTLEEVQSIGHAHGLRMLPSLHKPFRANDLRAAIKLDAQSPQDQLLEADLETALQHNWLRLWYQPKIDLQKQALCGAEGLIRMDHPRLGIRSPDQFLPPAGDQLYIPLTDYVVRRALADWETLAERGIKHRLAINVPASVLQRPDFVSNLRKHLPKSPDFPGLIVEITEDEAISDPDLAREIAVQLKLYNIGVSIDDFGAGYSTLTRFNELPFSEIKLDRSFVQGCSHDDKKQSMCKSVAQLAQRFGISSVAEGIETEDDLRVITEMGYNMGQGFLFAQPTPIGEFLRESANIHPYRSDIRTSKS